MIIGINGKIGVGKDTVGEIIQYLICLNDDTLAEHQKDFAYFQQSPISNNVQSGWQIKKFAGKLKTIASLLTGVPVEKFEDQEFKKQYMSEEWNSFVSVNFPEMTGEEVKDSESILVETTYKRMTYRTFLQKLGTEAMRDGLHTNVWVNALFADYKGFVKEWDEFGNDLLVEYPKWIVTDMRFPNEMEAIEERGGITIRVNRTFVTSTMPDGQKISVERGILTGEDHLQLENPHPSETALDDAEFHYTIENDGTLEELIEKVKRLLFVEGIL